MNNLKITITIFLLSIFVAITSCKKATTETPVIAAPVSGAFTYKVNGGAAITVDSANAVIYNPLGTGSRTIDVYAFKGGKQVLEFHFAPIVRLNNIPNSSTLLTYITTLVAPYAYDSQSGVLNLTTCDTINKNLIADFNFVGKDFNGGPATVNITEGHMVVTKLTKQ